MTYREDFNSYLAACDTLRKKKLACTAEIKSLRDIINDIKDILDRNGRMYLGEPIDNGTLHTYKIRLQYVEGVRTSL